MSSVVIGLLLVLLGAGGFALTRSITAFVPLLTGGVLALLGRSIMRFEANRRMLAASLAVSAVAMIFTASAIPRLARMLFGAVVDRPGDIFVIGSTAVLCLIHVTVTVRTFLRSRSTS
ncbi:MAG TPA: hypothetical protein VK147_00720 [Candidatus Didemnitutus sp.]|nr:hypothetical protein [Candidatus Didemnitutus sp.]